MFGPRTHPTHPTCLTCLTCLTCPTDLRYRPHRTRPIKKALYRRIHAALRAGGLEVGVDCYPALDRTSGAQFDA